MHEFEKNNSRLHNGLHMLTSDVYSSFVSEMSGKSEPISVTLDKTEKSIISDNRTFLIPIMDTIIFCGRKGIPLRGHLDDAKYHVKPGEYSNAGAGNFVELLNLRVRAGDKVLESHLNKCSKNASYISKTSQNKLIKCCGQYITDKIVGDVTKARFYSILADEASDISNKEQLSLVIRFVDESNEIREEFLKFVECSEGLSGEGLCKVLLETLAGFSIDVMDCRGQGYDGASAVSSVVKGLSGRILSLNEKALYTHCHSHRLNLAVSSPCSVQCVRNVMLQIIEVSYFFNFSPVRQRIFERYVEEFHNNRQSSSSKKKLHNPCRTRWVQRITSMEDFQNLFVPVVHCLEDMSLNIVDKTKCNPDTVAKAGSFSKLIASFDFIVTLVVARNILSMTLPVTKLLQGSDLDIFDGIHLIESLKSLCSKVRTEIDEYHQKWYTEAIGLAQSVQVEECKPRTVGRQINRANPPSDSVSDYFKKSCTIPVLDFLHSELFRRFDYSNILTYKGLSVIPKKLITLVNSKLTWRTGFMEFCEFYKDDLPSFQDLDMELDLWVEYWVTFEGDIPEDIVSTLKAELAGFVNISILLRILGTLPVTSCGCERSFSAMRRLKTYTRSTMVSDRLNGLALMHVHQDIVPDIQKVIDLFALDNRRLSFV